MYLGGAGRAGDAWQRSAGSPMAILQLQKRVVFKQEGKRSKQKQYIIVKLESLLGVNGKGLQEGVTESSFWCWAVCVSMAGPLVRAGVKE